MARRHDRRRREARRERLAADAAAREARRGSGPSRMPSWQSGILRFGKHASAILKIFWSGIKLPFDPEAADPTEGLRELTALALQGDDVVPD